MSTTRRSSTGGASRQPAATLTFPEPRPKASLWLERAVRPIDALFNRVYGSRLNPLYKSGALAVTFLLLTLLTGIYLFILYKVADPYGSVAELDSTWLGSLMRSIHRYSADLAVVAVAFHALKMLVSGRTWGARALAWVTGIVLLGVLLLCGWTGLVMAWDVQGQLVAIEGARLLDLLPVFSESLSRSFTHPGSVGRAFFFMNLFLHVALPLGLAGLFWLHSSRVARPPVLPPKTLHRYAIGAVVALSLLVPVPLPPKADLLAVPVGIPLDVFYAFWLPVARNVSVWGHLTFWVALAGVALSLPWWWRPLARGFARSTVDESHCAGCTQCYLDCPYEAIRMVTRDEPSELSVYVARVDPALCVACGICSGSCAPMGVGPGGRTGRDQLAAAESFLATHGPAGDDVVVLACGYGPGDGFEPAAGDGLVHYPGGCAGSVHTSVVELILRWGVGGVYLLTCPDRDCTFREGPKWLGERVYNDREAELKDRVDKRRVRIGSFALSERQTALRAVADFRAEVLALGAIVEERHARIEAECKTTDAYVP